MYQPALGPPSGKAVKNSWRPNNRPHRRLMPWRLAFWNDPHNPGNAVQCIDYPGARAGTHRLGQLVAAKVTHLRDLVIWLPRIARQHASSQEKHHVVLVWLGVDTDE